ncbi:unnamed protein product [Prorocentrum cordatum]|uniref:Uncharacterized protein n=1 Tax=Prorocentrum cordatum TaxID=2364126 RepID=A0ABN9PVA8_9DINO|nr:unnamed protein product [Polarella glacialis]
MSSPVKPRSPGEQTAAALGVRRPSGGRRGGRGLPLAWAALNARRRPAPSRARRAWPLAARAVGARRLVEGGGVPLMALLIAVCLSVLSRPSSLLAASGRDPAPPSCAAGGSWSLLARPRERAGPSAACRCVDGCFLGPIWRRGPGLAPARLRADGGGCGAAAAVQLPGARRGGGAGGG